MSLLLAGSWVVMSRVVISPLIWIVTLLITPLITTHGTSNWTLLATVCYLEDHDN